MTQRLRTRGANTSKVSEAELFHVEHKQARRTDRPRALPLDEVRVANQVFQWRNREENLLQSMRHLDELTRVLKSTKKPLDPIVVTTVGKRFYVLEGHHRLEAYRALGWRKPIAVRYFEGTVAEAQDEALRLNIKDKLPMSRAEKFDAAFRLVKRKQKTYQEISELTTVSVRTLATMADVLRDYPQAKDVNWARARALQFQKQDADGHRDWHEEKAQKLAKQLIKNVGVGFVRDTDITARALEIIDDSLPAALVHQWVDIAKEVLVEVVGEQNEALAGEIERAFSYPTGDTFGDDEDL